MAAKRNGNGHHPPNGRRKTTTKTTRPQNGKNGNGHGPAVVMPVLVPMPNGHGALMSGGTPGNRGGTGRPRSEVRAAALAGADKAIPKLIRIIESNESDSSEVTAAAKVLLQFGLGTTTTETDTEGRDVQVSVVRVPRRLADDN